MTFAKSAGVCLGDEMKFRVAPWRTLRCMVSVTRKEFGSVLCANYGIHAASRGLRHSAVAITDAFYSDSRVRGTVGMGHLLEPQKVVPFRDVA
jgi:hypothetical protein